MSDAAVVAAIGAAGTLLSGALYKVWRMAPKEANQVVAETQDLVMTSAGRMVVMQTDYASRLEARLTMIEDRYDAAVARIEHLEDDRDRLAAELEQERQHRSELERENASLRRKIEELERRAGPDDHPVV